MTVYRQNTNIEQINVCVCERAERASLENFGLLKLLFLSIFCRYIRYFVGTNDMLVGLHVPTNFQMYRQNSEKALLGGGRGGQLPTPAPPPSSGYANEGACINVVSLYWCGVQGRGGHPKTIFQHQNVLTASSIVFLFWQIVKSTQCTKTHPHVYFFWGGGGIGSLWAPSHSNLKINRPSPSGVAKIFQSGVH